MKREDLLAKGYTEEQVTDLLNLYHTQNAEISNLNKKLESKNELEQKYNALQKKMDDINEANMTEQERIAKERAEADAYLSNAKKINNKAKVKEILAGYDIEDDIINSFVSEDEGTSINGANLFKARLDTIIANTTKSVQDKISNLDVKPTPTNIPQESTGMTLDKFNKMTMTEQIEFKRENPEAYENLMN